MYMYILFQHGSLGCRGDAHEAIMGLLNSRSALSIYILNVVQLEMVTTGSKIEASVAINLNILFSDM